ncbi:universal stress protein [Cytobacillus sp. IB215316]|uniref:universal stress protein n=1 Tax=Cytobacillus sp. IB215316 TaxID=3097354 RepID=UPI002A10DBFF|nr:universal stress protein [Cytobacillus sp. IB215316]MDX8362000.1 universal stress protein [Cytobacillus sp. IB215316]
MFEKILLASDGSDHAIRAAEKAAFLAKEIAGATIEILYIVDNETAKSDALRNIESHDIESTRNERLQATKDICYRIINKEIKTTMIHGEPGPSIVKYANNGGFDLVVIGSRGLNTFQEMVLGSVSHKVAKRANCPVMIVK